MRATPTATGRRPHFLRALGVGAALVLWASCTTDTPPVNGDSGEAEGETGSETGGETGESQAAYHFVVELENIGPDYAYLASGVFDLPQQSTTLGPAGPDQSFGFEFDARPGDTLSLVSMLAQSNDWFVAGAQNGIALFDDAGAPLTGDRSASLVLYDAGTEANEALGEGGSQPASMADAGAPDSDDSLREIPLVDAGLATGDLGLQVTAELGENRVWHFQVELRNNTSAGHITTSGGPVDLSLAAGVWAVHAPTQALFEVGVAAPSLAFEALVEDARTAPMAAQLFPASGVTQVVSAGVWTVADNNNPLLFAAGASALDNGLEALAEDGKFAALSSFVEQGELVAHGVTEQSVVDYMNGPLPPGGIYRFEFDADPGAYLQLAHMFVPSNDWFIAAAPGGLALFDVNNAPILGPQTELLGLWDAGTEINQPIGVGLDQVHLQDAADQGASDADSDVREVVGPAPLDQLLRLRVISEPND